MSTQDVPNVESTAESTPDQQERQHLREQLRAHESRLRVLELQAAKYGDATEPHITIEINEIRATIAGLEAQLISATPAVARDDALQIRQQALKAFYSQEWALAEELLAQALQSDPDDQELLKKLQEAQHNLEGHAAYQAICELRDEGLWQAVRGALEDLAQQYPDYPDTQGLRQWLELRQHREDYYNRALAAFNSGDWTATIAALHSLLAEIPDDSDAKKLLDQAQIKEQSKEQHRQGLLSILGRHKGAQGYHLHPDIASEAQTEIRQRLESMPADEEILAFIVTTMFGGVGDGVAFTLRSLVWRNGVFSTPPDTSKHGQVSYDTFPQTTFKSDSGNNIFLAEGLGFNHTGWCELTSRQILALLNDIKELMTAEAQQ
jgi:tetratricopeptide (TPR) repeat protein